MTTAPNTTRSDTLFSLRYAVRVLERHGNLWARAGAFTKFVTIATGAGAVAAVISKNPNFSLGLGVLLALLQALEYALDPADKKAKAAAARKEYARLLANEAKHEDAALHAAYMAIVADDEVQIWQGIKELAYNDAVREKGLSPDALYTNENAVLRLLT